MKWPYTVVLVVTVAGMMAVSANKISSIKKISEESTTVTGISNFEKSPDKLKKLISAHRALHKKVKIAFASLIEELEPHIEYSDAKKLQELTNDLLSQYSDEINGAEKALQANDIVLTNTFLTNAAKELKNLHSAQTTLMDLRNQMAPKSPKQKNNETVKSASIPGKQTPGVFFFNLNS